jgi:hypothetical protein
MIAASKLIAWSFAVTLAVVAQESTRRSTVPSNNPAASMERKLRHLERNGALQSPDQNPTVITETEVNDYFALRRAQLPKGVKSLRFAGRPEFITAKARVNFDEVRGSGDGGFNPLMALFSGEHDVEGEARASGAGGWATIEVQSVHIDGIRVPRMALEYFVDRYVKPKHPEIGLTSKFQMPSRIDTATVGDHILTLTQK